MESMDRYKMEPHTEEKSRELPDKATPASGGRWAVGYHTRGQFFCRKIKDSF